MSIDTSAYGGGNGSGGRTYDSVPQILDKQAREAEAVAKAANPADLTDADLAVLPGEMAAELMREGKLAHLGFGRPHRGRRH
jgi:hypothetical protein